MLNLEKSFHQYHTHKELVSDTLNNRMDLRRTSKPPPTGIEIYQYLEQIWKHEQLSSFKDFLRWYNNNDVVPTLEAMQK